MNCDLDNNLLEETYYYFYTETADDAGHREDSRDAVQNQGSGSDKYSVKERNWGNIIA